MQSPPGNKTSKINGFSRCWAVFNHIFLSCSCALQATAPFLHIGALAAVTALSWLVAGQFARTEKASEYLLCPAGWHWLLHLVLLFPLFSPSLFSSLLLFFPLPFSHFSFSFFWKFLISQEAVFLLCFCSWIVLFVFKNRHFRLIWLVEGRLPGWVYRFLGAEMVVLETEEKNQNICENLQPLLMENRISILWK